ncbi:hypothetical protein BRADI_1g25095v3 [Brachypodium distachyon]|uniref:Uncharacterized protein n=1 Tax=Brachypodium distachyon TaxID=15368 RepID=A0A0Q3KXD1_BRADI|nr:hypothetical protein BRADI_1g25095v3 [Brachypodium distachyon]
MTRFSGIAAFVPRRKSVAQSTLAWGAACQFVVSSDFFLAPLQPEVNQSQVACNLPYDCGYCRCQVK